MMDNINKLKNMLLELPEIKSAEHIKSVESAVEEAVEEVVKEVSIDGGGEMDVGGQPPF